MFFSSDYLPEYHTVEMLSVSPLCRADAAHGISRSGRCPKCSTRSRFHITFEQQPVTQSVNLHHNSLFLFRDGARTLHPMGCMLLCSHKIARPLASLTPWFCSNILNNSSLRLVNGLKVLSATFRTRLCRKISPLFLCGGGHCRLLNSAMFATC